MKNNILLKESLINDVSLEMDVRNNSNGDGIRLNNGHYCHVNKNYKSLHSNFYETDGVSIRGAV